VRLGEYRPDERGVDGDPQTEEGLSPSERLVLVDGVRVPLLGDEELQERLVLQDVARGQKALVALLVAEVGLKERDHDLGDQPIRLVAGQIDAADATARPV
jgi:hypothetical protein